MMRTYQKILAGTALTVVLAMTTTQPVIAGFEDAVKAYEAGDYKTAYDEWKPLAEENDPAAMRNLGHLYRKGLGVPQDYNKAFSWYKRAAEMGFRRAQANVASMYLKGQGVEQDYVQAAEWFTRAAQNGHVISQYNLGLMYEFGKGVEKSKAKALAWYNLAAKAGHAQALNKLSSLVATKPEIKEEVVAAPAKEITPTKPTVAAATPKKEEPPVKVKKAPKVEVKPAAVAPKKPEVTVTKDSETPKASKQEPVATSAQKKFDPFAGSANNNALSKDGTNTAKLESTGAPTAFNQKDKVETVTAPKRVVVEPPKPASEIVVKTVEPSSAPAVKSEPEEVIVAKTPAEPKTLSPKLTKVEPVQTVNTEKPSEPVAVENRSADENAKVSVAETAAAPVAQKAPAKKEESKGFFSSLKSLIVGDDEEEKPAPKTDNANVALAPTPAVPAPVPTTAPVQVTTGAGLSVAERLEMATLSYELQEYHQALNVWASLAREGNATAQFNLGNMFSDGLAVPVDRIRAYYWWQKASAGGHKEAGAALAKLEQSLTFLEKKQIQNIN